MFQRHAERGFGIEKQMSGQHLIDHATERVDI
jgi:hypothetical protein